MTFGERIRAIRKSKGMTQKQVADRCNMADSAIRRYEAGGANPKVETIMRIANALGVSITELIDYPEHEKKQILQYEMEIAHLVHENQKPISEYVRELNWSTDTEDCGNAEDIYKMVLEQTAKEAFAKEQALKAINQTRTELERSIELRQREENTSEAVQVFNKLSTDAQRIAIERLRELTQIPAYQLRAKGIRQKNRASYSESDVSENS